MRRILAGLMPLLAVSGGLGTWIQSEPVWAADSSGPICASALPINGRVTPVDIFSVTPSEGDFRGGVELEISGSGFRKPTQVFVGGSECLNVTLHGPSSLTCALSAHEIGLVDVAVRVPGGCARMERAFYYLYPMALSPRGFAIPTGKTQKIKVEGGKAPYSFALLSGQGNLNASTGDFTATEVTGSGVIQVKDAEGRTAEATFNVYPALTTQPPVLDVRGGQAFVVNPTGGWPPYKYSIASGDGWVHETTGHFQAPERTQKVVVKVEDSASNSYDFVVNVQAEEIRPRKLTAGGEHTCAIFEGVVKCWGSNTYGQLGRKIPSYSVVPMEVPGLENNIVSIHAGLTHTCALDSEGAVRCWGDNRYGQLGDGTRQARLGPVLVRGLEKGGRAISSGHLHTCAVIGPNAVCWGKNDSGQLGDGSRKDSDAAVMVQGLPGRVTWISAGATHTCAVVSGKVRCWGRNFSGQLGMDRSAYSVLPVDTREMPVGVQSLVAGWAHTCAAPLSGGVKCWGFNGIGSLGLSTNKTQYRAVDVPELRRGVTEMSSGQYHTCAVSGGGAYCWGHNYKGQLGEGTYEDRWAPVLVAGLAQGVESIAAGGDHSCAWMADGQILCWGDNRSGQLGDGSTQGKLTPVKVK